MTNRRGSAAQLFKLAVAIPVIAVLAYHAVRRPATFSHPHPGSVVDLVTWTAVVAAAELLPVPVSQVLRLSLSFPVILAVVILYRSPVLVAGIVFVGMFSPGQIRREVPLTTALFDRAQAAISFATGGIVFHGLARVESPLYVLLPAVILATGVTYTVNVLLMLAYMRVVHARPPRHVLADLRVGALSEFLLSYLGLGLVGVVIAELYRAVGSFWSVAAFILPLVFARQMFFRNMALEEATRELRDRERVLRALSNRMAEERQDERMQIAAYLHDDLAQMLFRLNLQVEMAKKRLEAGDVEGVFKDLDGIGQTKQQTSDAIRALIRDLHRSPIGRHGLPEAIRSFAEDMSHGHPTTVVTDVAELSLPPPIQLLIYQIAREATMNALKHAEASTIRISLQETEDGVRLEIRDDGKGYDTNAPPPEGHFGTVMMRERAVVAGGSYSVSSEPGKGTTVTATFPRAWMEEGSGARETIGREPPVGMAVGPPPGAPPTGAEPSATPGPGSAPRATAVPGGMGGAETKRPAATEPSDRDGSGPRAVLRRWWDRLRPTPLTDGRLANAPQQLDPDRSPDRERREVRA